MVVVLVCGGRQYSDKEHLFAVMDVVHAENGVTRVIHGGAQGADTLAGAWAAARGIPETVYAITDADRRMFGNHAGPNRNARMLRCEPSIELVVAFPGGSGTADMVRRANEKEINLIRLRSP